MHIAGYLERIPIFLKCPEN